MQHKGRAVVFENIEHYHARIDDRALDIDEDLGDGTEELRAEGLSGHSGVGNMPAASQVLKGVTDAVHISMRG
jgi:dihydroxy-acid dehydratase